MDQFIVGPAQLVGQVADDVERGVRVALNAGEKILAVDGIDGDRANGFGGGVALSLVEDAHLAEHLAGAKGGQDNVAIVAYFGDFDGPENDFICHVARPAFAEDHVAVVEGFFRFLQIGAPKGFFVPFFQALKFACPPSHPAMLPTPGLGVNTWPEIKPK